jgi:glycosyltransferase involved in cell wall biosynthesis
MPSKRGLFLVPSLRAGGAERVMTLVLNGLAERGYEMHVALCQCEGYWLERLSPEVVVHDLRCQRVRSAGWPITRLVRSLKPNAILSTSSHLNTIAGLAAPLFPRGTRLLLRDVNSRHFESPHFRGLRSVLLRRAYRNADAIVCLVDGMRKTVFDALGLPPERVLRIFNPLNVASSDTTRVRTKNGPAKSVISIGSMYYWKGFDRLIDAFPSLLQRFPGSTLTILGDGELRPALTAQVAALGLADHVRMPGFCTDVRAALQAADLFVLASRSEGLPNVLLEAIEARCPFVSTEHLGGTREVLELLGQQHRITSRLDDWQVEWFDELPDHVHAKAKQLFAIETIVAQYAQALFLETAGICRAA